MTDAVTSIRHALGGQVPLFGFSGSPWTLATYMIEGGGSKDYRHAKQMMYERPELLHALLAKITEAVTEYLSAQIVAGANLVQIFDSWGGALGHRQFAEFSHAYNRQIIASLKDKHPQIPVVMFTKGGGLWLDIQADSQADALGFDWTMPLDRARGVLGTTKAIQGNLDPATLYGTPTSIRQAVRDMLDDVYGTGIHTGYVANLGHGITQWANPDHAKVLIDAVHEYQIG